MSSSILLIRSLSLTCLLAFLLTACGESTPSPTPTAQPTLNASLWMDFPALRADGSQAANIVVNDPTGQPVPDATAVLIIHYNGYEEKLYFPVTGPDGRSRLAIQLPRIHSNTTFTATVRVVDSNGRWDEARTSFEVYP